MTPSIKVRLGWICVLLLLANAGVAAYLLRTPKKRIPAPAVNSITPAPAPAVAPPQTLSVDQIKALIPHLKPLSETIHPPKPMDWLAEHDEPGQTFDAYLKCKPVVLNQERKTIYVQPLGDLRGRRKTVVDLAAEFMGIYFGTEVRVLEPLDLNLIPADSRRASRGFGEQIKSTTVLDDILQPRLPADAAAYIAFTAADLYPQDDWNFVFGQASLYNRVGVWSLARFGNPDYDDAFFRTCLLRTIKTATHETGHILSMYHCIACECNMNGSNHQAESDAKPLWLCPECLAKVLYATGQEPKERYRRLLGFSRRHALEAECAYYEKALLLLDE